MPRSEFHSGCSSVKGELAGMNDARGMPGYFPHRRQVSAMRMLARGVACVGLVGAIPAFVELAQRLPAGWSAAVSQGVPAWVFLLLLIAVLHGGYAAYLWQLPDWSAAWVVTLATLAACVGYAMALAATWLSSSTGWFVRWLQLSEYARGGMASGWCFIMLCLTSLLSYFSGRLSARWYQAMR